MFIAIDPAQNLSTKEKELQLSTIRSYTQSWVLRKYEKNRHRETPAAGKRTSRIRRNGATSTRSRKSEDGSSTSKEDQSSPHNEISKLSDPLSHPNTYSSAATLSPDEIRGIQFFSEKVATCGSSWRDARFWSKIVPQASHSIPGLQFALIALASVYEMWSTDDPARKQVLRELGLAEGKRALVTMNREYFNMSISAILTTYMVLASYTALIDDDLFRQILQKQFDIVDQLTCDAEVARLLTSSEDREYTLTHLAPLVTQERNHDLRIMDLLGNLAESPASWFRHPQEVCVLTVFTTLKQARDVLEDVLNVITFEVKSLHYPSNFLSPLAEKLLHDWHQSLQLLAQRSVLSELEEYSLALLRVCAKLNVIAIKTMNTEDEMVFDEYVDTYKELVTVGRQYMTLQSEAKIPVRFLGKDTGFITLFGQTAVRWCREPTVRQQLIDLLYTFNRTDGAERSLVWALLSERIKLIEEERLPVQPQHASDITAEFRVIRHEALFYKSLMLMQVRYRAATGDTDNIMDTFIYPGGDYAKSTSTFPKLDSDDSNSPTEHLPDIRVGKNYCFKLDRSTNKYSLTRSTQFNFCLPRY